MDVLLQPSNASNKPRGLNELMILWALGSALNILGGLSSLVSYLGYLPVLSNSRVPEWFRFGIPAYFVLSFLQAFFGFCALLVVYGLNYSKQWAYRAAFVIPLVTVLLNLTSTLLAATSPVDLGLREYVGKGGLFAVLSLVWGGIVWYFLRRADVKQYFLGSTAKPDVAKTAIITPSAAPVSQTISGKKYCRYCGFENKSDATFCEKCGRQIT